MVFSIASQVKEKQDTKQIISDITQGLDEHLENIEQRVKENKISPRESCVLIKRNEHLRAKIHEASSAPPSSPLVIIDLTGSTDIIDLTSDMELSDSDSL